MPSDLYMSDNYTLYKLWFMAYRKSTNAYGRAWGPFQLDTDMEYILYMYMITFLQQTILSG